MPSLRVTDREWGQVMIFSQLKVEAYQRNEWISAANNELTSRHSSSMNSKLKLHSTHELGALAHRQARVCVFVHAHVCNQRLQA